MLKVATQIPVLIAGLPAVCPCFQGSREPPANGSNLRLERCLTMPHESARVMTSTLKLAGTKFSLFSWRTPTNTSGLLIGAPRHGGRVEPSGQGPGRSSIGVGLESPRKNPSGTCCTPMSLVG